MAGERAKGIVRGGGLDAQAHAPLNRPHVLRGGAGSGRRTRSDVSPRLLILRAVPLAALAAVLFLPPRLLPTRLRLPLASR